MTGPTSSTTNYYVIPPQTWLSSASTIMLYTEPKQEKLVVQTAGTRKLLLHEDP